jgi:hypothetical protein
MRTQRNWKLRSSIEKKNSWAFWNWFTPIFTRFLLISIQNFGLILNK